MSATIEDLAPELLLKIFSYHIESVGHMEFSRNVVPVCSTWWRLSTTPSLWKNLRVVNWKYLLSISKRGLIHSTESLILPENDSRVVLHPNRLLAVLSTIRDLKALEISSYKIHQYTMKVLAEHCPNLERLSMFEVSRFGGAPITPKELDPIITICGRSLKQLNLTCDIEHSERVVWNISSHCASLEVFQWCVRHTKFPIYPIMNGCRRLRKLEIFSCGIDPGNDWWPTDRSGFEDLTVFKVFSCNFHGVDICDLLYDADNLEHLELPYCSNFIFSDISEISSRKVKILNIMYQNEMDMNFVAMKQAVGKWKHTLLQLRMFGREGDVTSVLETYLDGNPCPKLEVLVIDKGPVDLSFLKKFIQNCQNLKELRYDRKYYRNREELLSYSTVTDVTF